MVQQEYLTEAARSQAMLVLHGSTIIPYTSDIRLKHTLWCGPSM